MIFSYSLYIIHNNYSLVTSELSQFFSAYRKNKLKLLGTRLQSCI